METQEQAVNNRLVLLTIIGIPLTMILAATWMWYFVMRGELDIVGLMGTSNRGSLVQPPRSLTAVQLRGDRGRPVDVTELERHWSLLVPLSGATCDSACENTLYTTRQIHLAMGKGFLRIRRLFVSAYTPEQIDLGVTALSDDHPLPPDFKTYLAREQRGLTALLVSPTELAELFPERLDDPSTWYLVDPAGWIMMSYDSEIDYKEVMADLKFLLKNSNE